MIQRFSISLASTPWKFIPWFAALSAISLGGYLLWSARSTGLGFPLDDAWIHQTYARNLAYRGEWSFFPGHPSAGSTSPVWGIFLSIGYLINLQPLVFSAILGWGTLVCLAVTAHFGIRAIVPDLAPWSPLLAGLLVFEWHMVWAAASGMETLLAALLVTGVLVWLALGRVRWFWLGALIGVGVWIRPDLVTLLVPAGLVAVMRQASWSRRVGDLGKLVGGLIAPMAGYFLFNLAAGGSLLPNTFFAKQLEYQVLQEQFILARYLAQLTLPLVGAGVILLPGFFSLAWDVTRSRRWDILAGVAWWLGYIALYAWRLPVTYQHGRYIMPAMPIYFIWGVCGMAALLVRWNRAGPDRIRFAVSRAWAVSGVLALLLFWVMGGRAYIQDVEFIETEMVDVAGWIRENTAHEEVIAAHDIGAIGYFSEREIVDLAGLVSPDVIPFLRDELRLARYLEANQVDYLVTFPGWYPSLTSGIDRVYKTDGLVSISLGGENMVVYDWESGIR